MLPVVMRTRAICSPASNCTPMNEKRRRARQARRAERPERVPIGSKNCIVVALVSTSEKTAPKAETKAGCAPFVPGIENVMSVMLLSIGTKRRWRLKAAKVVV